MTHYDQREDLYAANQARAAQPITPQMFNVLYVLNYAGRVNGREFVPGITCMTALYDRGLVAYECPSVGIAIWWITDAGKARMRTELATRTECEPPLTAVLNPDAAERALFRPRHALARLQGNLSDVLAPPPAAQGYANGKGAGDHLHAHTHTGEHSHFHSVAGQHANDLRTPDAVSAMLTLPVVELPMEVKPMPPASMPAQYDDRLAGHHIGPAVAIMGADGLHRAAPAVHAHKVTDSGLMHALTPGGHPPRGPVTPHLTMGPNGQIGEHVDTWPSNEPLKTPLRARLFHDGSLVIDNPARPLVVRPMRPDDMTGHNEELISCELDAEVFIRAALMLSHAKANPQPE